MNLRKKSKAKGESIRESGKHIAQNRISKGTMLLKISETGFFQEVSPELFLMI